MAILRRFSNTNLGHFCHFSNKKSGKNAAFPTFLTGSGAP